MNTINGINGQTLAMDGHSFNTFLGNKKVQHITTEPTIFPNTAAEVSKTLADNLTKTKEAVQEIQKVSNLVLGHKLKFNVNNELGRVIVSVVDPSTNKVIREIPSEDLQKIQIQMKHAIGLLFDEMV